MVNLHELSPGGQQGREFFRRRERANQRVATETANIGNPDERMASLLAPSTLPAPAQNCNINQQPVPTAGTLFELCLSSHAERVSDKRILKRCLRFNYCL